MKLMQLAKKLNELIEKCGDPEIDIVLVTDTGDERGFRMNFEPTIDLIDYPCEDTSHGMHSAIAITEVEIEQGETKPIHLRLVTDEEKPN